jgi:hypothetical protein
LLDDKNGIHTFAVKPGKNDLGELAVEGRNYRWELDKLK